MTNGEARMSNGGLGRLVFEQEITEETEMRWKWRVGSRSGGRGKGRTWNRDSTVFDPEAQTRRELAEVRWTPMNADGDEERS
jgi:hypothetical protein